MFIFHPYVSFLSEIFLFLFTFYIRCSLSVKYCFSNSISLFENAPRKSNSRPTSRSWHVFNVYQTNRKSHATNNFSIDIVVFFGKTIYPLSVTLIIGERNGKKKERNVDIFLPRELAEYTISRVYLAIDGSLGNTGRASSCFARSESIERNGELWFNGFTGLFAWLKRAAPFGARCVLSSKGNFWVQHFSARKSIRELYLSRDKNANKT